MFPCKKILQRVMGKLKHSLFTFFSSFSLILLLAHAQDESGFISIDCGLEEESSYTDGDTNIYYTSDVAFIDTGVNMNIAPEFKTNYLAKQFWNVRSFPEGAKNCYTVRPARGKGNKYLIRAWFMYGNYDAKGQIPEFDLHLGVNKWDTVKLDDASSYVSKEIIHDLSSDYIYVCLVNTDLGIPFISALELRLLNNTIYKTELGSLQQHVRWDFGSNSDGIYRFKDDVYDRIWSPYPYIMNNVVTLSTSLTMDAYDNNVYQPASIVMSTAVAPQKTGEPLNFSMVPPDPSFQFYIYMHFAEVEELQVNQSRQFNIFLNGKPWYPPAVIPYYFYTTTILDNLPESAEKFEFSIHQTSNSTHPPIINAFEAYIVKTLLQPQSDQKDVDAIMGIKLKYGVKKNWQGDPCVPKAYMWDGLNCSFDGHESPRIISLNLSSSELTGKIAPSISNLTLIQSLDLSNNGLTGEVPDFLSQLPFLEVLNLTGNKLSGLVPVELIERSNNGSLLLSLNDNPKLCRSGSCKKKKKFVVPAVASVAAVFILSTALAIFWWLRREKEQVGKVKEMVIESNRDEDSLESKKRQFTYSELLNITNNFERIAGKGGFGTVFHGHLDGTQVAVKMLSPSSIQGYKQFQAEAKLLMRVHHRNVTSLIGYCNEGNNLGLIYEYMVNGNLKGHLSERNANVLTWEERVRIAIDAAQGLEYLHNGCKPPIIHRDIKSTNILLNEDFQAKLADFGLSRAFPIEGGSHVSTLVAGTPGYLDPEYYVSNRLTEKSDVFSFGVVLLEIITSRPVIEKNNEKTHIIQWVSFMLTKGDIKNAVDSRLRGEFDTNSVWKAVEVAMSCVSSTSAERPAMNHVVMELKMCLELEAARKKEGHELESKDSSEMVSLNLHTGTTPLAR